jgi:hypothetical protein
MVWNLDANASQRPAESSGANPREIPIKTGKGIKSAPECDVIYHILGAFLPLLPFQVFNLNFPFRITFAQTASITTAKI